MLSNASIDNIPGAQTNANEELGLNSGKYRDSASNTRFGQYTPDGRFTTNSPEMGFLDDASPATQSSSSQHSNLPMTLPEVKQWLNKNKKKKLSAATPDITMLSGNNPPSAQLYGSELEHSDPVKRERSASAPSVMFTSDNDPVAQFHGTAGHTLRGREQSASETRFGERGGYRNSKLPMTFPGVKKWLRKNQIEVQPVVLESVVAERNPEKLLAQFERILRERALYQKLLQADGELAQKLINVLQMIFVQLLDTSDLNSEFKIPLLKTLLRLSKRTGLYPTTLVLKGVKQGEEAVTPGHYGEIYKGKFGSQTVCLKIMKVYTTSQIDRLEQAFRKEALIWAHLVHPNLLPFYGIYRLDDSRGRLCLVSPWMDNGNITEYLNRHPWMYRFLLIDDIANGILYLHQSNIVHGDLKGANIMISPEGRACLGDFGLSAVLDSEVVKWTSLQSTAQAGGTLRWQAPELFAMDEFQEAKVSKASDIYAFACVCYEIVTDKVPFHELSFDAAVIFKVISGERPSKPAEAPPHIQLHGQWDLIWELMTACWKAMPSERLQARNVTERLAGCNIPDLRLVDNWSGVSPARFRHSQRDNGL
ncbi:kinase-like domain-containing protein [Cyathus striatus]|nr:kinase-like domain-containing protein [Cyathus striatus]